MKLALLLNLLLAAAAAAPADERTKQTAGQSLPTGARIAVIAKDSYGGSKVDRVVGDMLVTALRRAGMRLVERQELDEIVKEQRLAREGVIDPAAAVPSGQVQGAEYLLIARATEFGVHEKRVGGALALGRVGGLQVRTQTARVVLDIRLVDTRTSGIGQVETSEGKHVETGGTVFGGRIGRVIELGGIDINSREWSESSLGKAARKATDAIVKKLIGRDPPLQGAIIGVLDRGVVVINLGSLDGLREGDMLEVVKSEEVRDSKGIVIWSTERPAGLLRVVDIQSDRCKASPVEVGQKLAEGDIVRKRDDRKQPSSREAAVSRPD